MNYYAHQPIISQKLSEKVRGIVQALQHYTGTTRKGLTYTKTVATIGGYEFSFFNLKEGTLTINMDIEFVFVQKDRYYNALNRTLRIIHKTVTPHEVYPAEFRPIPSKSQ